MFILYTIILLQKLFAKTFHWQTIECHLIKIPLKYGERNFFFCHNVYMDDQSGLEICELHWISIFIVLFCDFTLIDLQKC